MNDTGKCERKKKKKIKNRKKRGKELTMWMKMDVCKQQWPLRKKSKKHAQENTNNDEQNNDDK